MYMTILDLQTYVPQKIFLLQGSESFYTEFITSANENFQYIQTLCVPRFTTAHAEEVVTFGLESTGNERLLVVYYTVFSPDAAQILLKSLEEPHPQTMIVFITPHPYMVPATIRSRVMLLPSEKMITDKKYTAIVEGSKSKALEYIKNEFSSDAEDDAATRRAHAVLLLDALEEKVRTDPTRSAVLYDAKHMLFAANMPTKYILEYAVNMVL